MLSSANLSVGTTSIEEEDGGQNSSEDENEDRPMSKVELQKRAAKALAGMQFSPKMQAVQGGKAATGCGASGSQAGMSKKKR